MRWAYSDEQRLARLYREGLPYKVIAQRMERTTKAVKSKGEKLGLSARRKPRDDDARRYRATFTLPDGLAAALDAECRRTGLTIGRLARMAITDRLGGA
jgi:hypothetical protein